MSPRLLCSILEIAQRGTPRLPGRVRRDGTVGAGGNAGPHYFAVRSGRSAGGLASLAFIGALASSGGNICALQSSPDRPACARRDSRRAAAPFHGTRLEHFGGRAIVSRGRGEAPSMFSRSTPAPSPKAKPARNGTPGLSFIGPEAVISGDLATDGQVHVDGRIDGDVKCAQLIQGAAGTVAGSIHADDARLAGTVEGTVSAQTLIIEATARILGDVAYETISIEAGAQIEGRLARRAALGRDGEPARIAAPVSFTPARRTDEEAPGEDRLFAMPDPAATPID